LQAFRQLPALRAALAAHYEKETNNRAVAQYAKAGMAALIRGASGYGFASQVGASEPPIDSAGRATIKPVRQTTLAVMRHPFAAT
jgi:hypothetical protein